MDKKFKVSSNYKSPSNRGIQSSNSAKKQSDGLKSFNQANAPKLGMNSSSKDCGSPKRHTAESLSFDNRVATKPATDPKDSPSRLSCSSRDTLKEDTKAVPSPRKKAPGQYVPSNLCLPSPKSSSKNNSAAFPSKWKDSNYNAAKPNTFDYNNDDIKASNCDITGASDENDSVEESVIYADISVTQFGENEEEGETVEGEEGEELTEEGEGSGEEGEELASEGEMQFCGQSEDYSDEENSVRGLSEGKSRKMFQHPAAPRCASAIDATTDALEHCFTGGLPWSLSCAGLTRASFGTPSYPSPLDRIRTGKRQRAAQLGLDRMRAESFEANQSFPKPYRNRAKVQELQTPEIKKTLECFKGSGMGNVSFSAVSAQQRHGNFSHTPDQSLDKSWAFFNTIGGGKADLESCMNAAQSTSVRNPNKAVVTINTRTTQILVANDIACELFDFDHEELIGIRLSDLLSLKSGQVCESYLREDTGEIVDVQGKVMEAVDSSGLEIPVSVWIQGLDSAYQPSRCLVVMEPVNRTTATVMFNAQGTIIDCDDQLAILHGYSSTAEVLGLHIHALIPSFVLPSPGVASRLPKEVRKQRATGRTRDGNTFPLSVKVSPAPDQTSGSQGTVYEGVLWVFANISGMITLLPDGTIQYINNNFALMLFGYSAKELQGKHVSEILPEFYEDIGVADFGDSLPLPPFDDDITEEAEIEPVNESTNQNRGREIPANQNSGREVSTNQNACEAGSQMAAQKCAVPTTVNVSDEEKLASQSAAKTLCKPSQQHAICESANTCDVSESCDTQQIRRHSDEVESRRKASSTVTDTLYFTPESVRSCKTDGSKSMALENTPDNVFPEATAVSIVSAKCTTPNVQVDTDEVDFMKEESVKSGRKMFEKAANIENMFIEDSFHDRKSLSLREGVDIVRIPSSPFKKQAGKFEEESAVNDSSKIDPDIPKDGSVPLCINQPKERGGEVNKSGAPLKADDILKNGGASPSKAETKETRERVTENESSQKEAGKLSNTHTDTDKEEKQIQKETDQKGNEIVDNYSTTNEIRNEDCNEIAIEACKKLKTNYSPKKSITTTELQEISTDINQSKKSPEKKCSPKKSPKKKQNVSQNQEYLQGDFSDSDKENLSNSKRGSKRSIVEVDIEGKGQEVTESRPRTEMNKSSKTECSSLVEPIKNLRLGDVRNNTEDEKSKQVIRECVTLPDSVNNAVCTRDSVQGTPDIVTQTKPKQTQIECKVSSPEDAIQSPEQAFNKMTANAQSKTPSRTSIAGIPETPTAQGGTVVQRLINATSTPLFRSSPSDKHDTSMFRSLPQQGLDLSRSSLGSAKSRKHQRWSERSEHSTEIPEGHFSGHCRHKDGNRLGVIYQIRRVELSDGSSVCCLWLSRDPAEMAEGGRSLANLTLATTLNSSSIQNASRSSGIEEARERTPSVEKNSPEAPINRQTSNESVDSDRFESIYEPLTSIGKGAFGFVKLAQRRTDGEQVVVKYIRKNKVLKDCWVEDTEMGRIPLEVSILSRLKHRNIVNLLDCFEDEEFFLMVMEKHGEGMDLFEFIDRCPLLDEPLTSYIFRQLVSAVSYIHGKNILHRDIKDENIILDSRFHIKVIDFGSVAFRKPGKLFGTFCGTVEYCSPEVLLGNKYEGPELEVWSMGVTLYTLIFGENPFYDVEETIQCVLKPPFKVSKDLMGLLCWILHPSPKKRALLTQLQVDPWVWQSVDIHSYRWDQVLPNSDFHGNTASDNRTASPEPPSYQTAVPTHHHSFH